MRVMIFCDMEGVCGIQSWEQTGGPSAHYAEGRALYTAEVNAVVRGCLKAGADSVIAVDGHGGGLPGGAPFTNWIPERLERGAEYVRGYPWARYTEPMMNGACDAVLLLAAHAMAGADRGVLSHTFSADGWYRASLNDEPIGEVGITAAVAGCFGVPVIWLSGDDVVIREARALMGDGTVGAQVKAGLGRYAARHLAPADACTLIEESAMHALFHRQAWPAPLNIPGRARLRVEYASTDRADPLIGRPGITAVDARTVEAIGDTFVDAWNRLRI